MIELGRVKKKKKRKEGRKKREAGMTSFLKSAMCREHTLREANEVEARRTD